MAWGLSFMKDYKNFRKHIWLVSNLCFTWMLINKDFYCIIVENKILTTEEDLSLHVSPRYPWIWDHQIWPTAGFKSKTEYLQNILYAVWILVQKGSLCPGAFLKLSEVIHILFEGHFHFLAKVWEVCPGSSGSPDLKIYYLWVLASAEVLEIWTPINLV